MIDPEAGRFVSSAKEGGEFTVCALKLQKDPSEKLKHAGENEEKEQGNK